MMNEPAILQRVRALGHRVYTGGDYDLNVVIERGPSRTAGSMDDVIHVVYRLGDGWICESFPCSADPGKVYLRTPVNPAGTAIIKAGQYPGLWQEGLHRGRPALVQVGPVTVGRDGDRDDQIEPVGSFTGVYAINLHDDAGAGADASAGCVVVSKATIARVLELVRAQRSAGHGEKVTLTIIGPRDYAII